jgi:hypothetical protein
LTHARARGAGADDALEAIRCTTVARLPACTARQAHTIEANVPSDLAVHLILDNYGTHMTALIRRWLTKRPCFHFHFTPTGVSWLSLVERWFVSFPRKGRSSRLSASFWSAASGRHAEALVHERQA